MKTLRTVLSCLVVTTIALSLWSIASAAEPEPPAHARKLHLAVEGMASPNCAVLMKAALSSVDGVSRVEADHESRSAVVTYLPERISEERLLRVVEEDVGFSAVPVRTTW